MTDATGGSGHLILPQASVGSVGNVGSLDSRTGPSRGRPAILIVGCGDIGLRIVRLLNQRFKLIGLTRSADAGPALRSAGAYPLIADLDRPDTLWRLSGLARHVIYLAPPPAHGKLDTRLRNFLPRIGRPQTLIYVSTTGVYGDCQGAHFDETRRVNPESSRAQRRVDAERTLRIWARQASTRVSIVRVPGIYAANRLPLERLHAQRPALVANEDVYTNHIHADDLAAIIVRTLWLGLPQRVYHASDDSDMKMGEYFDKVAAAFDLKPPPRHKRDEIQNLVSPQLWTFMRESRRLDNKRIKTELGVRLRYPSVIDGIAAARAELSPAEQ